MLVKGHEGQAEQYVQERCRMGMTVYRTLPVQLRDFGSFM
jgi:hypothetical protein